MMRILRVITKQVTKSLLAPEECVVCSAWCKLQPYHRRFARTLRYKKAWQNTFNNAALPMLIWLWGARATFPRVRLAIRLDIDLKFRHHSRLIHWLARNQPIEFANFYSHILDEVDKFDYYWHMMFKYNVETIIY